MWGPGVSVDVFGKWEERQELEAKRRKENRAELAGGHAERGKGRAHVRNVSKSSITEVSKGKGKGGAAGGAADMEDEEGRHADGQAREPQDLGPLVVLACRHIYHQSCLEGLQVEDAAGGLLSDGREFCCPIDG